MRRARPIEHNTFPARDEVRRPAEMVRLACRRACQVLTRDSCQEGDVEGEHPPDGSGSTATTGLFLTNASEMANCSNLFFVCCSVFLLVLSCCLFFSSQVNLRVAVDVAGSYTRLRSRHPSLPACAGPRTVAAQSIVCHCMFILYIGWVPYPSH